MKISNKIPLILAGAIGLALGGCASPTIVLKPTLPPPATPAVAVKQGTVQLIVDGAGGSPQLSRYEERGDKTQIGSSESLGVHLSDFWVKEPPPKLIQRMLENNLRAWGFRVTTKPQPIQLHGHVNEFSLNSKARSLVEFQADGVVDIDLDVINDGTRSYRGHYVGTCTFKTATQIPNETNMGRLFNVCLANLQKRLDEDGRLRAALSSH